MTPRTGGLPASAVVAILHTREPMPLVSTTTRPQPLAQRAAQTPVFGGAAAVSVGVSVPEGVVHSHEIEERLGLAPAWIERRTGIRSRHVARTDERLDQHATEAAAQALRAAGIDPADVDA